MKKLVSLVLCISMIMSLCLCVNAANFSDLAANHWAYSDIDTLVNEGTIKGYPDGTFKPSKTVTRAEFAKMIGKWSVQSTIAYTDISSQHWAYDYIMWSGLDPVGTSIRPDEEIKRSEVINLIWKRNGSPEHNGAPSVITSQSKNKDAASWAYTIGLMKGDDGLNLRLDSPLTRAEAATLIIRSRKLVRENQKNNFVDLVNEDLLKIVYEGLDLLGDTYNGDKVLTYGELAKMSVGFGANYSSPNYVGDDSTDTPIDHKYAKEMYIVSSTVWGMDTYTVAKADTNATVQDAIGAIMHGFVRRGTAPTDMGKSNGYYPDCKDVNKGLENIYLTYANNKGVKLYANENLGADEPITAKKFAALMIQFNHILGLDVKYENGKIKNAKTTTYVADLPQNYKDYKGVVAELPMGVFNVKPAGVSAKSRYHILYQCAFVYNTYLSVLSGNSKQNTGYSLDYTFYPSASFYDNNGKVVFVAKVSAKMKEDNSGNISVDSILGKALKTPTNKTVAPGQEFYLVFETYETFFDISLAFDEAFVKEVIIP